MGTNYYARKTLCEHCGAYEEEHIGKSSIGWTFSFKALPGIRSYRAWLTQLSKPGIKIYNEYGESVSLESFKDLVESKKDAKYNHSKHYPDSEAFFDEEGHSFSEYDFS